MVGNEAESVVFKQKGHSYLIMVLDSIDEMLNRWDL